MKVLLIFADKTKKEIDLLEEEVLDAGVLIRQDSRMKPEIRVFRFAGGSALCRVGIPVFEETKALFINPEGI